MSVSLRALVVALAVSCSRQAAVPDPGATAAAGTATDDAPCKDDAGCALTLVEPGGCCAALCHPRAVTRGRAAELEASTASCSERCDKPQCAPLKVDLVAVCVEGRCRTRPVPPPVPPRKGN